MTSLGEAFSAKIVPDPPWHTQSIAEQNTDTWKVTTLGHPS